MNLDTILAKLKLTGSEIKIYKTLLAANTPLTTGPIITTSKVARSKVYELIERLEEKGLIVESIHNNVRQFSATSPNKLLDYLHRQKTELAVVEENLQKELPKILADFKEATKADQIKLYVGHESILSLYQDILDTCNDEYLGFSFSDEARKNKGILIRFDHLHKERKIKGNKAKILCTSLSSINDVKKRMSEKLYEFRETNLPFPKNISIFADNIAFFVWGATPKVFVITSKEQADEYKKFFYTIWKIAKKKS